jgi:spore coat polysaccharide biosynthesis predicted glycosyltransferase SpsG
VTLKIIQVLQHISEPELKAKIVVGPANPHLEILRQAIQTSPNHLQLLVDVKNMPELMAWAELAISGGGGTCWEMAFMGVPNMVVKLADNQTGIAERLEMDGVAINLGGHEAIYEKELAMVLGEIMDDLPRRRAMSERGRRLVDGCGAARVAAVLADPNARCDIPIKEFLRNADE